MDDSEIPWKLFKFGFYGGGGRGGGLWGCLGKFLGVVYQRWVGGPGSHQVIHKWGGLQP